MEHSGGCHCGKIRFQVQGEIGKVVDCNCSMCSKRGSLLWFVSRDQLRLLTAVGDLGTYTFNTHALHHHFCPVCGIAPFSEGADPKMGAAVNVRCLDGVDLSTLVIEHYDGRSR